MRRVRVRVGGYVQGVGFRWWGVRAAGAAGLTGTVGNRPDGSVEFHLQGSDADVAGFVARLRAPDDEGRPGQVSEVEVWPEAVVPGEASFRVV